MGARNLDEIKEKKRVLLTIDILIMTIFLIFIVLAFLPSINWMIRVASGISILFFSIVYIVIIKESKQKCIEIPELEEKAAKHLYISSLLLLNEDKSLLKEWNIYGKISLIIGRNLGEAKVDIDLSDVASAAMIAEEHAVMNYCNGHWYIENNCKESAIEIQKLDEAQKNILLEDEPCQLYRGDTIYICNVALLIK